MAAYGMSWLMMYMSTTHPPLPELLAPAGSPDALEAALAAGADAVYLGGTHFNARMNAHNFDAAALREAVTHAHRIGGRVYLTLNTLVWDRELPDALAAAYEAAAIGVDALIIADPGAAALIHRAIPGLPLHASTQMSGHNAAMGHALAPLGFSRFVIARETRLSDIATAVRSTPLEVEVFIHGALCVSHSGQCLFSSVVGGRSGNRGECAQPCRLPYGCAGIEPSPAVDARRHPRSLRMGGKTRPASRPSRDTESASYPLSLKDLTLASHVPDLIQSGVASLKIEGRMKSPGYVAGVTAMWRRLLDEHRAATPDELGALEDLFSRGGFTDGYQTGRIDAHMMGVRSESDKERTAGAERAALHAVAKCPPHLPAAMTCTVTAGSPATLTVTAPLYRQGNRDPHMGVHPPVPVTALDTADAVTVTVTDSEAATADSDTVGLTAATVEKQLTRTGGTPYRIASLRVTIQPTADGTPPALPLSRLNALRRSALEALDQARLAALPRPVAADASPLSASKAAATVRTVTDELLCACMSASATPLPDRAESSSPMRTARFHTAEQITLDAAAEFDILYLPLGRPFPSHVPVDRRGILLPPVVFDHETAAIRRALASALAAGIRHVMVGNLGHLPLLQEVIATDTQAAPIRIHGDFRFNVANTLMAARLLSWGMDDLLLSPELTLPRMRDISLSLARPADTEQTAARTQASVLGRTGTIVYGRLPLMLLEKCAIRAAYRHMNPSDVCRTVCARHAAVLRDRMGKQFPILRESAADGQGHRNIVYNSLPLAMSDRADDLARACLAQHHFLFTTETPVEIDRVIAAYRRQTPIGGEVRRIR